ncbi:DUF2785 domain-containing protein [Paenisporosarcina quisquiliarum]|uniref:DUF2785 domain-containing protein n=1 Tax=Paenisporosarcina quisquiliarum TaxID=365346 RepID=UPI00373591C0
MTTYIADLKRIISGESIEISHEFLDKMIENISSVDPELRDELNYSAFWKLINNEQLSKQQIEYILTVLLDQDLLMAAIENPESDAVFTRSFTVLFFAAILHVDDSKKIVDEELVRRTIDASLQYLMKEQDLRGFVEKKGWAHAAAHGADLMESIAKHPFSTEEDALKILTNIHQIFSIATGFKDDEEERIARSFVTLSQHHLNESQLSAWLMNQAQTLKKVKNDTNKLQSYYSLLAFKNFLKSTFFLLERENIHDSLQDTIKELVKEIMY